MKIYDIALMMVIFNLVSAMVYNMTPDIFGSATNQANIGVITPNFMAGQSALSYYNTTAQQTRNFTATQGAATDWWTSTFGFFNAVFSFALYGLPKIVQILWDSTLGVATVLEAYGVPANLAVVINTVVLIIYALGIIQFISGRSVREPE